MYVCGSIRNRVRTRRMHQAWTRQCVVAHPYTCIVGRPFGSSRLFFCSAESCGLWCLVSPVAMDTDDEMDLEEALRIEADADLDGDGGCPTTIEDDNFTDGEPPCIEGSGCKAVSLSPGVSPAVSLSPSVSSTDTPSTASSSGLAPPTPGPVVHLPLQDSSSQLLSLSPQSVEAPARKRLRGKTCVVPVEVPVPPDPTGGIWENYDGMTWPGHRAKYFWVYNKFRHWASVKAGELTLAERKCDNRNYMKASRAFRDLEMQEKHDLLQEFMCATSAPRDLRKWAHTVWPQASSASDRKARYACYCRQVLWTYQGEWGVFPSSLVNDDTSMEAAISAIGADPEFARLWDAFHGFMMDMVARVHVKDWALSAELCTETLATQGTLRVHFHAFWKNDAKFHIKDLVSLLFKGSLPHKAQTLAALHQRSTTGWGGMYYLSCPKIGLIKKDASLAPFTGYPVSGDWVFSLVQSNKMEMTDARAELLKVGKGIVRKMADLDKIEQLRKEERVQARVLHVQSVISMGTKQFKSFPAIDVWKEKAMQPYQRRKKFLVLEGSSGLGKTEYVRGLFGVANTLELNCGTCGDYPSLRAHDSELHKCVLFDEGSIAMVLNNRKLFQAPSCWVDFGHSPTGRDVYRVFFGDSAIVLSSNKWSEEFAALEKASDRNWITENQMLVYVTGPMWEE